MAQARGALVTVCSRARVRGSDEDRNGVRRRPLLTFDDGVRSAREVL